MLSWPWVCVKEEAPFFVFLNAQASGNTAAALTPRPWRATAELSRGRCRRCGPASGSAEPIAYASLGLLISATVSISAEVSIFTVPTTVLISRSSWST